VYKMSLLCPGNAFKDSYLEGCRALVSAQPGF
jgi:hypothetical protein